MSNYAERLLRRSDLRAGESLPSLLARLAQLNHYDPPRILDAICLGGASERDAAMHPMRAETFERIASLTGIVVTALYASTAHRFAPTLTPPDSTLECWTLPEGQTVPCLTHVGLSRQLRPVSNAQFCPTCIRRDTYHRLIWTPVAVSACLQHKCVLLYLRVVERIDLVTSDKHNE